MINEILFALTFVYGTLKFLTLTNMFHTTLNGIIKTFLPNRKVISKWIDVVFFYFCLCYQAWFWYKVIFVTNPI